MESISDRTLQNNLTTILDQVNNDHIPIIIHREDGPPAVLLSLEDFNSYQETAYLMSSAKNAQRLNEAIQELREGKGIVRELIE
ncbi:type II toxin-antitoxin system prevent-host-death family antitoxin [Geminocystis sp. GBBB08]|uniref:type II toxin-antitoxin system Phd/YefM family antitoxin n=1 Tax=Geminocystis sp. GBBB08 TaxID=2604140 RepID=UPI0027E30AE2|nr:type II toxin-antitoxin system prevent-host-death family antitoxin [Geminocystis sp. GBBB08]MBL1210963.1 type II toxin-antitoxin system prevent-host-death family antitoxin [Geminocystis sp. GBBB08]